MPARSAAVVRLRRWLPRLLGLALSVVAIIVVGPRDVARGLRAANLWLVAIAAVAVFPLLAPKARRWQIVLADFGIALPWRDAFRFYAIGLWAAIVTPGQLGDGLKAWYVQSRGGNLAPALASVVVDRLFDVLMLLAAAALGVVVYGAAFGAQFALVGLLTVVTIVGIIVAARPALRNRVAALLPASVRTRLARMRWVGALRDAHLAGGSLGLALGWSLVSFGATLARIYLCFRAVDIRLPLVTFIAVVGLSSLAGLLSISGIGTRDWALIALLGREHIGHETALAASFLILFLNLTNIVPGLIAWYRDPVPLRRRAAVGRLALRNTFARLVVWTAFVAFGFVGVVHTGLTDGPAGAVFATAQSIVQQQTIAIDGNTTLVGPLDGPTPSLAYANNHFVATAEPGAALLAVPAAWVGIPLADSLNDPGAAVLLVGVMAILLALLAAVAMSWAGVRLGLPPLIALVAGAIGAGTLLFPVGALTNATLVFMLASALLALALADGADERVEAGWTPHGRLALAGLLLGCLPFAIWSGWIATGVIGLTLVLQGGRRWWRRIPWLALGVLPPLALLALYNAVWYGRPWRGAWLYAVGDPWQRTLHGRYLNTPLTALRASLHATGTLAERHPLLVLGWIGLIIGLFYVPWRARVTTLLLFVTLAVPALVERQPAGIVAEQRGVVLLMAFAAVGYVLLIALVAREQPALLPWAVLAGVACIVAGAAVSVATNGAKMAAIVPVGDTASAYVAPIALCVGVIFLLLVPGFHVPRIRNDRALTVSGVAILLFVSLAGCSAVPSPREVATNPAPNLLPPVSTRLTTGAITPLWTLDANARIAPDGGSLSAAKDTGMATSPRVPVHAGDDYLLSAHVLLTQAIPAAVNARIAWFDAMQQPLGESSARLTNGLASQDSAAPAGTGYATVSLAIPAGALVDTIRLQPRDGARIDALPNYAKAALAFSFDFETAMGGLIHTRGGTTDHDVADAEARGLAMRQGANFLRGLFAAYDTRATFYVNGYNFLTGNTQHRQFVGNPTYTRYTPATAGFVSDYWTTHPWYSDDPFGTEDTNPAWYFGSLTKQLAQDGNDIESHTFGHLFLHAGITPQQLDDDLTTWDQVAKENGFAPAHSFAFPWAASNSLTPEYYAVLAKHGITNVTRFYDNKPGTVQLDAVPGYPSIRIVPDQELIDRQGDEAAAQRGIDTALASGGVFSVWAHPENIATANTQAIWGRIVAYAADRRSLGLWVAPVTTITNFVDARDQLHLSSVHVGANTVITVRNGGTSGCNDATLTLPGLPKQVAWSGGSSTRDINGAQIRVGNMAPGETVTIEIRYP